MAEMREDQPSFTPGRKWRAGFTVVIGAVALLAIVVMVNYISRNHFFHRAFLSNETRIRLSAQTLGLLKSVTNDVKITLYYDKLDPMFSAISDLATEYRLANPKISVETVDYTRDTILAQKVKAKYKLDSPTDKDLVIFDCEGRTKQVNGKALTETTIEEVENEREREFRRRPVAFKGEMLFSGMLLAVTSPQPLKAYYLVGHGEHPADKEDDEAGYLRFISLMMQNYVKVQALTLLGTNTVPADCNLLVIAGPKSVIPEVELDRIEAYLESGGRLLVLFTYTTKDRQLGLEALLAKWGVKVGAHTVKDDQNSLAGYDVKVMEFGRHPVVNPLLLSGIHLMLPRSIGKSDNSSTTADAPEVVELAFTSRQSLLIEVPDAPPTNYPVAVAVEKGAVPGTSTKQGTTRIVVVGDSLFLGNKMIDSAANRDFAGYVLNWLLDRTQLMQGLGPRPVVEYKLVMTQRQLRSAQWILVGGLPGIVLVIGLLVWLRRRN